MKRARTGAITLLFGATLAIATVAEAADQTAFINSQYAKLRDGRTSASVVLTTLKYGDKVQILQEQSGFVQVKVGTQTGWVAKAWTSASLPTRTQWAEELGRGARNSTAGGTTATTGARGLGPDGEALARKLGDRDKAIAQVQELDKLSLTPEEIDTFLQQGQLGDYQPERTTRALPAGRTAWLVRGLR